MLSAQSLTKVLSSKEEQDKKLDKERILFQDLSFKVSPGEILVICGPSGCGKTTLLRLLAGLDRLESGEILLNSKSPSDLTFPVWRARVSYVPQKSILFQGTPRKLYTKFLSLAAQQKLHKEKGDGVNTFQQLIQDWNLSVEVLDRDWNKLSGGEYQRVYLALAISLNPDVLLLDEPTAALDQHTKLLVERTFLSLRDTSIIIISHDSEQIKRLGSKVISFPLEKEQLESK